MLWGVEWHPLEEIRIIQCCTSRGQLPQSGRLEAVCRFSGPPLPRPHGLWRNSLTRKQIAATCGAALKSGHRIMPVSEAESFGEASLTSCALGWHTRCVTVHWMRHSEPVEGTGWLCITEQGAKSRDRKWPTGWRFGLLSFLWEYCFDA